MNEGSGVVLAGEFGPKDETPLHIGGHLGAEVGDVFTEVVNAEGLLVDVGGVGTTSNGSEGCQVAAVASHRFDYKDAALASCGTLLNLVDGLGKKNRNRVTLRSTYSLTSSKNASPAQCTHISLNHRRCFFGSLGADLKSLGKQTWNEGLINGETLGRYTEILPGRQTAAVHSAALHLTSRTSLQRSYGPILEKNC